MQACARGGSKDLFLKVSASGTRGDHHAQGQIWRSNRRWTVDGRVKHQPFTEPSLLSIDDICKVTYVSYIACQGFCHLSKETAMAIGRRGNYIYIYI